MMHPKFVPWFIAVAKKTAINPQALMKISNDLTKHNPKLLKHNNFFAVKPRDTEKDFHKYKTPHDGIQAGVDIITRHPKFQQNKIGTLKANENLQYQKLRELLNLSTS
jgi:hypothetical protein